MTHEGQASSFRIEFESDPFAVRDALAEARMCWSGWGLDPDLCDTAEQVLAEVLNNIVEHAHADSTDGSVILSNKRLARGVRMEVRDNGVEMPDGALPAGRAANVSTDLEDLPEGGFGWFLIRSLTDDLSYAREGDWNALRFNIVEGA